MPSRQCIPRIRVEFLGGSTRSLSSSRTLDIEDILSQARMWPNLLAKDPVFDNAVNIFHFEDDGFGDVPPFPTGRHPPFFTIHSHRARLPFPLRPEASELGEICEDEGSCPILTAPTIPRMKMMMMEQLYVQKWVDTLTSHSPPKHIPWSCEKPAIERRWTMEDSIFPADVVKFSTEWPAVGQEHLGVADVNDPSARADHILYSNELYLCSEPSSSIRASTECRALRSHALVKSAEVDPAILRGESRISHPPHSIIRTSQTYSSPVVLPSGPIGTSLTTPDASLAARRGKSLGGLNLNGSVIERLEYPDIPTAFRGSLSIWSPRFDAISVPPLTDHQTMLLNLRSKCAALEITVSTYALENIRLQSGITRTSLDVDEWMFTRGLDNISGPGDREVPKEASVDMSNSLPCDSPTPAKGPSSIVHLKFVPRPYSTPLQSPIKRASDPPRVPLPPRPALVNPSTPPHVRGILKKAKSVRFEDTVKESQEITVPSPSAYSSPQNLAMSGRPCTPMLSTSKITGGSAPVKGTSTVGKNKKLVSRPQPLPKRTKANGKLEPMHANVGHPPVTSKSTMTIPPVGRPCRTAHVKKNSSPVTSVQAQAKHKGLPISNTDTRRGIEGTAKGRLSVPLRNIFRLK